MPLQSSHWSGYDKLVDLWKIPQHLWKKPPSAFTNSKIALQKWPLMQLLKEDQTELDLVALSILCSNTLLVPVRRKPPLIVFCQKHTYKAQVCFHLHAGRCHGNNGSQGFCHSMLTWRGKCPLPFVDGHNWSSEHSCSTHMLEELAFRPIKRLAAGIASWLARRMREPMLQRIIQLREHQLAKLTQKYIYI